MTSTRFAPEAAETSLRLAAAETSALSAAELLDWLVGPDLADPSGHCLSWHNPSHPGYPYPEITGLLLALLGSTRRHRRRQDQLIGALLAEPPDGVGRGPVTWYAFDTAMALGGVVASLEQDPRTGHEDAHDRTTLIERADRWVDALTAAVHSGRARVPTVSVTSSTRWSDSFGAHQSKLAVSLIRYARWVRSAGADPSGGTTADRAVAALRASDALLTGTVALSEPDGRFRIHDRAPLSYLHAHCYAMEGLLAQTTRDDLSSAAARTVQEALDAGARWLATVQQLDGGFLAWHDGRRASGPTRTDATAQAVRLWLAIDPAGFAGPVTRALALLERARVAGAGVPYEPGSADVNAWASMFTAQALQWRADGARPIELV
ncbi:MAG: hypothetical protein ACRC35_12325 [Angustibacter sp.]